MNKLQHLKFHQALFITLVMLVLSYRILTLSEWLDLLFAFVFDTTMLFVLVYGMTAFIEKELSRSKRIRRRLRHLNSFRTELNSTR